MDVSKEAALAACEQARRGNRRSYFSADHWQCWGCMRFGGEPEKRCMHADDGWNGCAIVNRMLPGARLLCVTQWSRAGRETGSR